MITPELLEVICCPETHQPLKLAGAEVVASLNARIASGVLRNRAGKPVNEKIDGAFIREDGTLAYIIRDDIPVMLVDEAIVPG